MLIQEKDIGQKKIHPKQESVTETICMNSTCLPKKKIDHIERQMSDFLFAQLVDGARERDVQLPYRTQIMIQVFKKNEFYLAYPGLGFSTEKE